MSVDLKLQNGEILMSGDDLCLVSSTECLIQDIKNTLYHDIGSLFYDEEYGIGILRFIHSSNEVHRNLKLSSAIQRAIEMDSRVAKNTVNVDIRDNEELIADITFYTNDGEFITLQEKV